MNKNVSNHRTRLVSFQIQPTTLGHKIGGTAHGG